MGRSFGDCPFTIQLPTERPIKVQLCRVASKSSDSMKKVRFQSPKKIFKPTTMDELECHSPRPFTERRMEALPPDIYKFSNVSEPKLDVIQRCEYSNSSPYPLVRKTDIHRSDKPLPQLMPTYDLELSMLDSSEQVSRQCLRKIYGNQESADVPADSKLDCAIGYNHPSHVLSSIENKCSHTKISIDNDFFIRRDNLDKYRSVDFVSAQKEIKHLNLDKENNPVVKKLDVANTGPNYIINRKLGAQKSMVPSRILPSPLAIQEQVCGCHHCIKLIEKDFYCTPNQQMHRIAPISHQSLENFDNYNPCSCRAQPLPRKGPQFVCSTQKVSRCQAPCQCTQEKSVQSSSPCLINAVDKKTLAIQKYEQNKNETCTEIDRQTNVVKEKREPTVTDLFKIIKLQSEQLQLLQDKVDRFISTSTIQQQNLHKIPIQNTVTEQIALQNIDNKQKISIGVMTSFEMVRTSTMINKEIVTQTHENAQIQCNRSQISIKEVVSKTKPKNANFLDGIMKIDKHTTQNDSRLDTSVHENITVVNAGQQQNEYMNEEKTLNENSLYNVQVDNATTPLMSPEQSMYLDVRDYSDSDASADESNVGWTYYNKVMNHVNGMLQDSEMPSSASAMYRNTKQQCVQMQIDKTNISVTKRVKFGDDPKGILQPHLQVGSSDTSIKMNQLAAKYLKNAAPPVFVQQQAVTPVLTATADLSLATRNYMERHHLLQGFPATSDSPPPTSIPKFLDITALKQQPKFL